MSGDFSKENVWMKNFDIMNCEQSKSKLQKTDLMFLFRPGLKEVVTDDDGFETEIIEFRNAVIIP